MLYLLGLHLPPCGVSSHSSFGLQISSLHVSETRWGSGQDSFQSVSRKHSSKPAIIGTTDTSVTLLLHTIAKCVSFELGIEEFTFEVSPKISIEFCVQEQ